MKEIKKQARYTLTLFFISISQIYACYIESVPITIHQPNGKQLNVFTSGTEEQHWIHDKQGFTIILDENKYYVYASLDINHDLFPTIYKVDEHNPTELGLIPNLRPKTAQKKHEHKHRVSQVPKRTIKSENDRVSSYNGKMNQLVIFVRFSDQIGFNRKITEFEKNFNALGQVSVRQFFQEVSGGQMDVQSHFFPNQINDDNIISYTHNKPRSYYLSGQEGFNSDEYEGSLRERSLVADIMNGIKDQIPTGLLLDNNNDAAIDNVVFIFAGSVDNWGGILWPHRNQYFEERILINDAQFYDYNFGFENASGPGVMSHELFHTFGAPDLYSIENQSFEMVGYWDLMSVGDWNNPQHMNTYYKQKYGGWIDSIPTIMSPGNFSLDPISTNPFSSYKIPLTDDFVNGEFLLLEYRKKDGLFESSLPNEGLIVYRINPKNNGNNMGAYSPTGQNSEVFVYRPNSQIEKNGIAFAPFRDDIGRNSFDDYTDPKSVLSDGSMAGFFKNYGIFDIKISNGKLHFQYKHLRDPKVELTIENKGVKNHSMDEPLILKVSIETYGNSISEVDFYSSRDGKESILGTDTSAPYQLNITELSIGNTSFFAIAKTGNNKEFKSETVSKNILGPSCKITGQKITGKIISSEANNETLKLAYDNDIHSTFKASVPNAQWIGYDLGTTKKVIGIRYFSSSNNNMLNGKFEGADKINFRTGYELFEEITEAKEVEQWHCVVFSNPKEVQFARYFGAKGSYSEINEIEFIISNDSIETDEKLTITLDNPKENEIYILNQLIDINAQVTNQQGEIEKVEFYLGNQLIQTDYTFPYTYSWRTESLGSFQFQAKAYNSNNRVAISNRITFEVEKNINLLKPAILGVDCIEPNVNYTFDINLPENTKTIKWWWTGTIPELNIFKVTDNKIIINVPQTYLGLSFHLYSGLTISAIPYYLAISKEIKIGNCNLSDNLVTDIKDLEKPIEKSLNDVQIFDLTGNEILKFEKINLQDLISSLPLFNTIYILYYRDGNEWIYDKLQK